MAVTQPLFGAWDYAVLICVLLISSMIGIYYRFTGGKQKTTKEYLLADKNMPVLPVAFSLMASFMSAITLLGVSSENYSYGIQFIAINVSYAIFTWVAAYYYLPVFFQLQATSAYEYLEKRFGKTTRTAASLLYTFQMVLYMGIVLYAPAIALEALTGINRVSAILSVGLVCMFYSTIGGMKAVLITDVFQSLLMFAAVISIIVCAVIDKGSFSEIWRIANEGNRTGLWNFDIDPTVRHSWFSLTIGGGVTFLSLYAVNQTQVQRYMTVKDLKTAQKALWWNWPILTALSLTTSFSGLAIYSKYHDCDPVKSKVIATSDQLMPLYVVDSMGHIPGVSGLFVAGIFSASLSTVSAALNSLAAVTVEDYYKPLYKRFFNYPLTEKKALIQSKLIAFIYGGVCLVVAFLAQLLGGVLQAALTIFGTIGGPLLGIFTLGMFTTTANQKGTLLGLCSGAAVSLWMAFGQPKPPLPKLPVSIEGCEKHLLSNITMKVIERSTEETQYFWLYRISYLYQGVFGFLCTVIIGYIASMIFTKNANEEKAVKNPDLFVPPLSRKLAEMQKNSLKLISTNDSNMKEELTNHL
ncbi:hypothetical protein HHI36_006768 [Cryptolaemus montrouzieri]|uniref:Sodium-dependent multivitamin transporter n=1 Tax=Cryptolaemus montrouzieri TaxID=559131 RepID=A0ABD2NYU2_9CUCU